MALVKRPRILIRCFGPQSTADVKNYIGGKYAPIDILHLKAAYNSVYEDIAEIGGALRLISKGEIPDTGIMSVTKIPKVILLEEGVSGDDTRLWQFTKYMLDDQYDVYEYKGYRGQGSSRSMTEFPKHFIDDHLSTNGIDEKYEDGYIPSTYTYLAERRDTTEIMDAAIERVKRKLVLKRMRELKEELRHVQQKQDKYAAADKFWDEMESSLKEITSEVEKLSTNFDYEYESAGYQFDRVIEQIEEEERLKRQVVSVEDRGVKKKV